MKTCLQSKRLYAFRVSGLLLPGILILIAACSGAGQLTGETEQARFLTEEDYRRAEQLLNANLQSKILYSDIQPEWLDGSRFWYRLQTYDGHRFMLVNAARGQRDDAFDHERIAGSLGDVLERNIRASKLPFQSFRYVNGEKAIRFMANGKEWECDLVSYHCEETDLPERPPDSVLSPDRQWAAYIKDHNLWVRNLETGEDRVLTRSGEYRYGFATNSQGWFRSDRPVLHWSPDSRKIATYRLDERGVADMHLLRTAGDRPVLESWPYALPGDTVVPMHDRVVLDVKTQTKTWLDVEPSHQRTSNCCGLERDGQWADIAWSEDASQLAFVTTSRDYKEVNLYIADTGSGRVRHIYGEQVDTFFESNLNSRGHPNWRVLFDSETFIWFSRRDEWGHLYYHRLDNGELIGRITSGDWNVVDVLHIDETGGTVYFTAVGREEGRDPYLTHYYRAKLPESGHFGNTGYTGTGKESGNEDESANAVLTTAGDRFAEPVLLTPEVANHEISVSPDGSYFVDEYSGFRTPSVTRLRSSDGSDVMVLEEADISLLRQTPFTKPEPFTVKARDGETTLYGLMYKPSFFDSSESWPVVVNLYPGPQIGSVGTRSFTTNRRGQPHALAELGFVVIQVDALGSPMRSKSFHTAWYGDMSDNGLEDQVAALQQLGERYDWLDTSRAGIYGHSGGGYATAAALLRFPGVFKAGVASAGNMDNRGYTFYWGEKYHGARIVDNREDTYASQAIWKDAGRLEDNLLITYGTMDSNVHPNTTLLLIDELIKENKDFDLIVMPNRGHGFANERYHVRRTWDYFVRHLLQAEPPHEFRFQ